jgi:hypothetical protein
MRPKNITSIAAETEQRLFTYSIKPTFVGNTFNVNHAGRAWATIHEPGAWAFESGIWNTIVRMWRTGQVTQFKSVKEITGPAKDAFVKVQGLGPARGWKRVAGQYFTTSPGDLDLVTGIIQSPTVGQTMNFAGDVIAYYGVDGVFFIINQRVFYVSADLILNGEDE